MNASEFASSFGVFCLIVVVGVLAVIGVVNLPVDATKVFKHEVIIIDGCEYLKFYSANNYEAITHKGNCKNH